MAANFLKKDRSRAPLQANVKRVLRQGNRFVCGICRKVYASEQRAMKCLDSCADGYTSGITIIPVVEGGKSFFMCGFCRRKYTLKGAAKECAENCRGRAKDMIKKEQDARTQIDDPMALARGPQIEAEEKAIIERQTNSDISADDRAKFDIVNRRLVCKKCKKEFFSVTDVIDCFDRDSKREAEKLQKKQKAEEKVSAPAPTPEQTPAPQDPVVEPISLGSESVESSKFQKDGDAYLCSNCRNRYPSEADAIECFDSQCKASVEPDEFDLALEPELIVPNLARKPGDSGVSDEEKFTRDGARYVCKKCQKRYFTRVEVIECFDSD